MRPRRSNAVGAHPRALERRLDGGLVDAGLLAGQGAGDRDLLLRRQVDRDLRVVLAAAEHEGGHQPPQPGGRALVVPPLDRDGEPLVEGPLRAEQARVGDVHDGPQLGEPVLDRRPGHRDPDPRRERPRRASPLGRRVLDLLRLVEDDRVPVDVLEHADVASEQRVRGDRDVAGPEGAPGHGAFGSVVADHGTSGANRASSRSQLPTTEVGHTTRWGRSCWREVSSAIAITVLPEAHLVGEDPAHPELGQPLQPRDAATLVGPQVAVDADDLGLPGGAGIAQPLEERPEVAVGDGLDPAEVVDPVLPRQRGGERLGELERRVVAGELRHRSTVSRSTRTQVPRHRTSGCFIATISANSSGLRVSSPSATS
jgi:hypothetical protein